MIAVWLVGPPSDVASPTIRAGSRPAVSAGARSSAHRIDGTSGTGTPGSGRPLNCAMTRSRMSCRSVTRSAISPPILVNMSANFSTASAVARTAGVPILIHFSDSPSHARSWASCAVAASTSEADPVAWAARSRNRSATAAAAAENRASSASRSASATSMALGHELEYRMPARADDRRICDPWDNRNAGEDRAGRRSCFVGR